MNPTPIQIRTEIDKLYSSLNKPFITSNQIRTGLQNFPHYNDLSNQEIINAISSLYKVIITDTERKTFKARRKRPIGENIKMTKNELKEMIKEMVNEALEENKKKLKESLLRYADTDEQERALEIIERLAKEIGVGIRFGTKVGKYPQTIILDHKYQDNAICIHTNGSIEIGNGEFGSWDDEYFDIDDEDEDDIKTALISLKEEVVEEKDTEGDVDSKGEDEDEKDELKESLYSDLQKRFEEFKIENNGLTYEFKEEFENEGHKGIEIEIADKYGDVMARMESWDDGETYLESEKIESRDFNSLDQAIEYLLSELSFLED